MESLPRSLCNILHIYGRNFRSLCGNFCPREFMTAWLTSNSPTIPTKTIQVFIIYLKPISSLPPLKPLEFLGSRLSQVFIQPSWLCVSNPTMHVLGLWEEIGVLGVNPCKHANSTHKAPCESNRGLQAVKRQCYMEVKPQARLKISHTLFMKMNSMFATTLESKTTQHPNAMSYEFLLAM